MDKPIYIHYGATKFNPSQGFPIHNIEDWMKPKGGLWASRKSASFGWKQWCEEGDFRKCETLNSFEFSLKNWVNLVTLYNSKQLHMLPEVKPSRRYSSWYSIDFEKCVDLGIDAIELSWYGDEYMDAREDDLHSELYGWDCDSIIVLNPDTVIQLT